MAGIADTISRLHRMSSDLPQRRNALVGDRLSDIDDFGPNPGQLRARVYIPGDLAPGAALVVVLHGCTQTAAGYDLSSGWSKLADRHGFAVLFPEQRRSNNPNLCFNWFLPEDTRRGGGEALSIRQMVDTVRARHSIDAAKIFVTGLSAGGAMTSVMLATYPDVFAGGAIIAGLPYGIASSVPSAFQLMSGRTVHDPIELMSKVRSASAHQGSWPTISVWHGTADSTVDAANAGAVLDQWRLIHDVPASPTEVIAVNGFPRRSWRDAQGREVIAEYLIPGMAHGTPLDTNSGIGQAAAFMLDVGICSTQEITRFWGLDQEAGPDREEARSLSRPAPSLPAISVPARPARRSAQRLAQEKAPARGAAGSAVGKIIEDALRAAGLMK